MARTEGERLDGENRSCEVGPVIVRSTESLEIRSCVLGIPGGVGKR